VYSLLSLKKKKKKKKIRARSGYKFDARVAKASNMIEDE